MSGLRLPLGDVTPLDVPEAPDVAPGMGQARDEALDADARRGMPAPLPDGGPSAGEQQAAADLDASIEAARSAMPPCYLCGGSGWVPHEPGLLGVILCPGCGGVRASTR